MKNRRVFQTRQYMLNGDYEIYHYQDTGLTSVSTHHHDFYEVLLFISGIVTYLIEGKAYDLRPGDIVLVNSRELHQAVIRDLHVPYERIVLWIDRSLVQELSTAATDLAGCFHTPDHKNVLRTDLETQQRIRASLNQIIELQQYQGFGRELLGKACLTELLVWLNNEMQNISKRQRVDVRKSRIIEDVIEYINNHLEEILHIDDLADRFFLSKFHLSREFREQTGTTLHRFILQKKLIQAKELILKHLPITDVYQQCGFGDYSNFFRAFRNEFGITPKQYYDQMRRSAETEP